MSCQIKTGKVSTLSMLHSYLWGCRHTTLSLGFDVLMVSVCALPHFLHRHSRFCPSTTIDGMQIELCVCVCVWPSSGPSNQAQNKSHLVSRDTSTSTGYIACNRFNLLPSCFTELWLLFLMISMAERVSIYHFCMNALGHIGQGWPKFLIEHTEERRPVARASVRSMLVLMVLG